MIAPETRKVTYVINLIPGDIIEGKSGQDFVVREVQQGFDPMLGEVTVVFVSPEDSPEDQIGYTFRPFEKIWTKLSFPEE